MHLSGFNLNQQVKIYTIGDTFFLNHSSDVTQYKLKKCTFSYFKLVSFHNIHNGLINLLNILCTLNILNAKTSLSDQVVETISD